jgi:predicted ribosome quality control (RQC) complex YloA/Tae2 family protein
MYKKGMRTQIVFIKNINREITFHIGKNQYENFDVIDQGNPSDIWFHAKNRPSCHVVCQVPQGIQKKELS